LSVKEVCHNVQRFFRFRQLKVVPEGMRQGFEDDQLRIHSGLKQRAMKD
jgi:hypothetical protein